MTAVMLAFTVASCATPGGASGAAAVQKKREVLRDMRDRTLADLYATKPELKAEVQSAVGYAVFDASQVNLVLYLGAQGAGMMVDNSNGSETFMKMTRAGTGPGVGYKTYRQLMVFKDRTMFDTFKTVGADVGASADATFKTGGTKGMVLDGSTSFNPMLSVYQVTDSGMLLQANWGGVAYLPDSDLNAK
jgi:lipid-binding SYLF domain-containing protein